jgi:hypothetical protein
MKHATIEDGRNGDEANEREAKRSEARKERVGPRRGRQLSVSPRWQETAGMYRG